MQKINKIKWLLQLSKETFVFPLPTKHAKIKIFELPLVFHVPSVLTKRKSVGWYTPNISNEEVRLPLQQGTSYPLLFAMQKEIFC